jgi:hypothetical protein
MDLMKNLSYIFDDDEWVTKLAIMAAVGFGAGILMIFLGAGLLLVAAQMGWMVQLIRNMRHGDENPMPDWSDFGGKIRLGAPMLGAWVVYSLLPLVVICFMLVPVGMTGSVSEDAAAALLTSMMCTLFPLLLFYGIPASVFYAAGTVEYVRTEEINAYFKFGQMWRTVSENMELTGQLVLYYIIIQVGLSLLSSTGVGSIVVMALNVPIVGYLLGQYVLALEQKKKRG